MDEIHLTQKQIDLLREASQHDLTLPSPDADDIGDLYMKGMLIIHYSLNFSVREEHLHLRLSDDGRKFLANQ